MMGHLDPFSGVIERGETLSIGYYSQAGIEFKPDQTVFDVVHDIAETVALANGDRVPVSTFLNYFLFPPHTHYTKVEKLSGGEKRRLYLLTVLMRNPNFLILDEPTNDLDIMTLNVLEEYLQNFPGSLLIVSHDRFFLDKLADHIFIFQGEGRVKDYVGKCSEWRQYVKDMRGSAEGEAPKKKEKPAAETVKPKSNDGAKRKLSYKEQRELEQVEGEMERLGAEKVELEGALSSGALSGNELTTASVRIGEVIGRLDELEMRWLELQCSLD